MTPAVLWELRHPAGHQTVWCAYRRLHSDGHLVTVNMGELERFREQHNTEADAHEEAAYLLDHFLRNGWIDVAYRDPRIAHI